MPGHCRPNVESRAGYLPALRSYPLHLHMERHRAAELAAIQAADLLIGVTPTITAHLQAKGRAPAVFVPNAIDTVPVDRPPPAVPQLVYAGSLAYGRDLQPIFAAMAALRQAGSGLGLTYIGNDGTAALAQAETHGVTDLLTCLPQMPSAQALAQVAAASAGIVLSSPGYGYAYPGKIFEILAEGRPILAIGEADSEIVQLPRTVHCGWSHTPDDHAGLVATLHRISQGDLPQLDGLQRFSVDATMRDLDAALRRLIGS